MKITKKHNFFAIVIPGKVIGALKRCFHKKGKNPIFKGVHYDLKNEFQQVLGQSQTSITFCIFILIQTHIHFVIISLKLEVV